ncbi:MAG: hypothetical protein KAJ20_02095 [Candidatus Aenigmarchaeota archaeon]|nr:hypothetical protein [Candidatus Aenigmarchaeota archaeon]
MPEEYSIKLKYTHEKGTPNIHQNLESYVETDIYIPMSPVSTETATVHITAIIKGEAPVISPC